MEFFSVRCEIFLAHGKILRITGGDGMMKVNEQPGGVEMELVGVSVKMPAELRDRLAAEAAREERTLSQLVRLILGREIERLEQAAAVNGQTVSNASA